MRLLFRLFAALALVAGFLLFVLSGETDQYFSWTIKPSLTAAFLGASYWAAFVLIAWSSSRRRWLEARPAVLPVLLIACLLLVATLIHLERFHHDLFGRFWLAAYVVVPPVLLFCLWRQLSMPAANEHAAARASPMPLPGVLRGLLVLQAIVMLAVGAVLYVSPGSADSIWPWQLTPLTARAIGAFVFGFGAAAADAVVENQLERFRGAALAYAVLGALELVAALRYTDDFTGATAREAIYLVFVATVLLAGLYGLTRSRAASSASSRST
jgi:hypothetical protein